MRVREVSIRLRRFEWNEKRQKVNDLELMVADFRRMAGDLQKQIGFEEQRSGIKDKHHFAYSTLAKAAWARHDNLASSITELEAKLGVAREELADVLAELNKAELAGEAAPERGLSDGCTPAAPRRVPSSAFERSA